MDDNDRQHQITPETTEQSLALAPSSPVLDTIDDEKTFGDISSIYTGATADVSSADAQNRADTSLPSVLSHTASAFEATSGNVATPSSSIYKPDLFSNVVTIPETDSHVPPGLENNSEEPQVTLTVTEDSALPSQTYEPEILSVSSFETAESDNVSQQHDKKLTNLSSAPNESSVNETTQPASYVVPLEDFKTGDEDLSEVPQILASSQTLGEQTSQRLIQVPQQDQTNISSYPLSNVFTSFPPNPCSSSPVYYTYKDHLKAIEQEAATPGEYNHQTDTTEVPTTQSQSPAHDEPETTSEEAAKDVQQITILPTEPNVTPTVIDENLDAMPPKADPPEELEPPTTPRRPVATRGDIGVLSASAKKVIDAPALERVSTSSPWKGHVEKRYLETPIKPELTRRYTNQQINDEAEHEQDDVTEGNSGEKWSGKKHISAIGLKMYLWEKKEERSRGANEASPPMIRKRKESQPFVDEQPYKKRRVSGHADEDTTATGDLSATTDDATDSIAVENSIFPPNINAENQPTDPTESTTNSTPLLSKEAVGGRVVTDSLQEIKDEHTLPATESVIEVPGIETDLEAMRPPPKNKGEVTKSSTPAAKTRSADPTSPDELASTDPNSPNGLVAPAAAPSNPFSLAKKNPLSLAKPKAKATTNRPRAKKPATKPTTAAGKSKPAAKSAPKAKKAAVGSREVANLFNSPPRTAADRAKDLGGRLRSQSRTPAPVLPTPTSTPAPDNDTTDPTITPDAGNSEQRARGPRSTFPIGGYELKELGAVAETKLRSQRKSTASAAELMTPKVKANATGLGALKLKSKSKGTPAASRKRAPAKKKKAVVSADKGDEDEEMDEGEEGDGENDAGRVVRKRKSEGVVLGEGATRASKRLAGEKAGKD